MPNSLPELEAERSQILGQFTTLGDLRPVRSARFLAAAENRPAIAPNPMTQGTIRLIRLTRKAEGRTVAESFPSPAACRKAQSEIEEHHRFQKLSSELVAVNEKIGMQRPLESESRTWTPEEKKRLLRSLRRSPAQ